MDSAASGRLKVGGINSSNNYTSDQNGLLLNSSTSSMTASSTTTGPAAGTQQQHQQLIPFQGSSSINSASQQRVPLHVHHNQINGSHGQLSFERKSLLAATSATVIGLVLMLVAVSTDYWLVITNPGGAYLSHEKLWRMKSHSGIFRTCNIDFRNETHPFQIDTRCQHHVLFPSDHEASNSKHEFDPTSLNYTRTEVAFSTMGIILMVLGQVFAVYSFNETRYMYKRITAVLHFLSASCVLTCIEVLVSSVTYEQAHLPFRHPASAVHHFGFSFVLACVTCAAFFAAGGIFLIFSRKRKEKKLATELKTFDSDNEQGMPLTNSQAVRQNGTP